MCLTNYSNVSWQPKKYYKVVPVEQPTRILTNWKITGSLNVPKDVNRVILHSTPATSRHYGAFALSTINIYTMIVGRQLPADNVNIEGANSLINRHVRSAPRCKLTGAHVWPAARRPPPRAHVDELCALPGYLRPPRSPYNVTQHRCR